MVLCPLGRIEHVYRWVILRYLIRDASKCVPPVLRCFRTHRRNIGTGYALLQDNEKSIPKKKEHENANIPEKWCSVDDEDTIRTLMYGLRDKMLEEIEKGYDVAEDMRAGWVAYMGEEWAREMEEKMPI